MCRLAKMTMTNTADERERLYIYTLLSEFFETARVGEHLAEDAPRLLGSRIHGGGGAALEEVKIGQEVVRAASVLQTGDELEKDAVDAVSQTRLVPLHLPGVFLTLVQQQRLHVIVVHWPTCVINTRKHLS